MADSVWVRALSFCLSAFAIACSESGADPGDAGAAPAESPERIRDTTGAQFEFAAGELQTLQSVESLAIDCGGRQFTEFRFVRGNTGLAMVCAIDPRSDSPADYLCRPVACNQPPECPADFICDEGLCQCRTEDCRPLDTGDKVHSLELMARCLGKVTRYPRCLDAYRDPSWATVNDAILTECDGDGLCAVPTTCR